MSKSYEMDMVNGSLWSKIMIYALPLIITSILQLMFNASDIIIVGKYSGETALAAVGSTSSLINLLVHLFLGISIGVNVLVGRYYGAKENDNMHQVVHSAILLAILSGFLMIFVGGAVAKPVLQIMSTPQDVINQSTLYMRIYFCGMPGFMVFNFGAAVLRGIGDTKRPLYALGISGIVNVVLNYICVRYLHMGVAGVAITTVISQYLSAVFIIWFLVNTEGAYKLDFKKLRFYKSKVTLMLTIGIPAGIEGALFSISNVLIQSSINSFGSVAMAGNTAAVNAEGFLNASVTAFGQSALTFISQNMGAGKYERINKILFRCIVLGLIIAGVFGWLIYFNGERVLSIYTNNSEVIANGMLRIRVVMRFYIVFGIMNVMVSVIRGLGYSLFPTIVSLIGVCVFRVVWVYTAFEWYRSLDTLYISYPISWATTGIVLIIIYIILMKTKIKRLKMLKEK